MGIKFKCLALLGIAAFACSASPARAAKAIGATCTWHGSAEQSSRPWSTVQFHRPGAWNLMVWRGRLDPVLPLPKSELAEARSGQRAFPVVVPPEAMAGFMGAQYGEVNLYWELGKKEELFAPSQGLLLCSKCERGDDGDCRIYVFTQGGEHGPLMNVFPSTAREESAASEANAAAAPVAAAEAGDAGEADVEEPPPPPPSRPKRKKRADAVISGSKSHVTRQLPAETAGPAPVTFEVPKDGGDRARLRREETAQPEPTPTQLQNDQLR